MSAAEGEGRQACCTECLSLSRTNRRRRFPQGNPVLLEGIGPRNPRRSWQEPGARPPFSGRPPGPCSPPAWQQRAHRLSKKTPGQPLNGELSRRPRILVEIRQPVKTVSESWSNQKIQKTYILTLDLFLQLCIVEAVLCGFVPPQPPLPLPQPRLPQRQPGLRLRIHGLRCRSPVCRSGKRGCGCRAPVCSSRKHDCGP